ncbi:Protein F35H10.10 [Aphelenchoides avenae]|nr:Protein F35H10.10 [Aphelenchus avenae]
MVVKAVQLRNAETLGFSAKHRISYWNYWLLLFFIVGVQIALSARWATVPRMVVWLVDGSDTRLSCAFTKEDFLGSQAYTIVLLLISLFLNSLNRKIKRNYKETKWLFVASVACTVLFVAWIIFYGLASYDYKEYIVVLELHLCGAVLLAFLFGPKIYILLSYEPVVVECHGDNVSRMSDPKDIHLFESDELRKGAVSPSGSTRTTQCGSPMTKYNVGAASPNLSCLYTEDGDQSPMFQTVMRPKKRQVRRSQSEHDQKDFRANLASPVNPYPSPPYSPAESIRGGRVSNVEHRRY